MCCLTEITPGSHQVPGGVRRHLSFALDFRGDYFDGTHDKVWLAKNYAGIRQWAEKMLATDRNGNGLIEYIESGNSGSWPPQLKYRPSNWWDAIGFGHEDAYANALAYRALGGMETTGRSLDKPADAARYRAAADKLRAAYFKTFYNPATGVLAGWRSADGQLHDYYFLWVNGIAIHYGLVPKDQANAIMDRLLAKMKAVGYERFDLGLPGIDPSRQERLRRLAAPLGRGKRRTVPTDSRSTRTAGPPPASPISRWPPSTISAAARRPTASSSPCSTAGEGRFQGFGPNGMTNDWKAWDGTPWGYEGFLVDNYYVLLAVLAREGSLENGLFSRIGG